MINCGYQGNNSCFCLFPQVTYLHTKNERGVKNVISNFVLLSQKTALNFFSGVNCGREANVCHCDLQSYMYADRSAMCTLSCLLSPNRSLPE